MYYFNLITTNLNNKNISKLNKYCNKSYIPEDTELLDLSFNKISDIKPLIEYLKYNCNNLINLALNKNNITNFNDVQELINVLKTKSNFVLLDISYNNISDTQTLIDVYTLNKYCNFDSKFYDYLILNGSGINDLNPIINYLKNNKILKLKIHKNQITNLNLLSEFLKYDKNLKTLNLSYNKITDINYLCNSLKNNHTLKHLDLSYNNIIDLKPLYELIETNNTITKLYLKGIKNIDINKLVNSLLKNSSIKRLYLKDCNINNFLNSKIEIYY